MVRFPRNLSILKTQSQSGFCKKNARSISNQYPAWLGIGWILIDIEEKRYLLRIKAKAHNKKKKRIAKMILLKNSPKEQSLGVFCEVNLN